MNLQQRHGLLFAWAVLALLLVSCEQPPVQTRGAVGGDELRDVEERSATASAPALPVPPESGQESGVLLQLHHSPLDLPFLDPEDKCPVTEVGSELEAVAQTYGAGPVYATLGSGDGSVAVDDTLEYGGWHYVKVLWSARRSYEGPVVIRGRQLDGGNALFFSPDEPEPTGLQLVSLSFPPGTVRGNREARFFPTTTLVSEPGCYAFQVDGDGFRDVIVFRAVR